MSFEATEYHTDFPAKIITSNGEVAVLLVETCSIQSLKEEHGHCIYEMKVFSSSLASNENLLSKVVFDAEPRCTAKTLDSYYIETLCVTSDMLLSRHKISTVTILEFSSAPIDYNFRGTIHFCYRNTQLCTPYDIPVHANDANKYDIWDERADLHGNKYLKPQVYNLTQGSVLYSDKT